MSRISPEDAYLIFDKWRDEQAPLQLVMKRPPGLRAVNSAFIKSVLPHYFAGAKWVCFLAATFPNGNRYIFGERAAGPA